MILAGADVVQLAQLSGTSLDPLKGIILPMIGTVVVIILAFRSAVAFAEDKPGKLVGAWVGAVLAVMVCFFPDTTLSILKGLGQLVLGGQV